MRSTSEADRPRTILQSDEASREEAAMTLRRGWRFEGEGESPTNRLEALADGVFAIVMTLLVLELGVPVVAEATNAEIGEALAEMWPEFLIYALSFLVLGAFWLMHKMMFESIVMSDPPLTWLNVVFGSKLVS